MDPHQRSSTNIATPLKSRFARGFLRALVQINSLKPHADDYSSPPSPSRLEYSLAVRKYRKIKRAAYASMALAVGTRRAWSRATLWRIRRRAYVTGGKSNIPPQSSSRKRGVIRKKKRKRKRKSILTNGEVSGPRDLKKLRELVPGGEGMDACCLLDETADYIKCLVTQLQRVIDIDRSGDSGDVYFPSSE